MNPMFGSKSLWAKFWLISTLCFVLCLANPILEEDSEDSDSLGDEEINAVNLYDYLQRLAASRSSLYENPYMVSDMLRDRRRGSMAENNFQLRVRKRGAAENNFQLRVRKSAAENNFQLRVRKDFMDRIRNPPQIRSSAEDNFQLRVRRKPSSAERNFQLRVRKSDPNLSLRQTFLEKIRERRFQPLAADQNFQLRVRRSPELTNGNNDE